ncbi:MAG TPA: BON domain-containing protein [Vicinamibacterales bacterium]|nr:BON domain-containing protein [Vicinamibacterales bacterium]
MRLYPANRWLIGLAVLTLAGAVGCERIRSADETARTSDTYAEATSDVGITTAVQAKFYTDDTMRETRIDVSTSDGAVTLRGTVESEATRQTAVRLARSVEGVTQVEDRLHVSTASAGGGGTADPGAMRPGGQEAAGQTEREGDRSASGRLNASWITTKIQAQYFVNRDINPFDIDVTTTSDGVVTLSGRVDSQADRDDAVRIARMTDGVARVEDQLRVAGEMVATSGTREGERADAFAPPDAWLTAKIQSKYFLDDEVRGRRINVDTADGVVTLRGAVESESEKRQALALARSTDGVVSVRDELLVSPPTAEPGPDVVDRIRDTGARVGEQLTDAWITTKIQSKYFLDESVKSASVNVDTRDGVVTLTGQVGSPPARQAAESIAKETTGVTRVVNKLTVAGGVGG